MWYVCDVLYAVLYVCVNCFVKHGCAVAWRYIDVFNCGMFSVVNVYLDHLKICVAYFYDRKYACCCECYVVSTERDKHTPDLCDLSMRTVVELCTLGCFA